MPTCNRVHVQLGDIGMRHIFILAFLFIGVLAHGQKKLSGVQVSPHGAAMHSGTVQFSVACLYTDGSTDNCSGKTVSWYSSQPTLASVNNSGLASYVSNCGSGNYHSSTYGPAVFCDTNIVATVNGFSDYGTMLMQYPGDVIQVILSPGNYGTSWSGTVPNILAVGATGTFGAGMGVNGSLQNPGNANPFPGCNWSSSNPSVGTINRYGFFTAVAVGTSVVSCVTAGNATYSPAPPTYTVTVVAGGTGSNTWYVRPDGGTPYTNATDTPVGQCNGLANARYPGSGVDQPCAFGDFEDLYFDQTTTKRQWVIAGGDTVIVYPKPTGYNTAIISVSGSTVAPTNCGGDSTYCDVPWPPSGSTGHPTRILGSNYASCTGSYGPNPAMTSLLLGYGRKLIDTSLTQNVDIECFEMADRSFKTGFQIGINQSAFTSNATFKNLFIHNATASGIFGASGLSLVVDHVHIRAAAQTGINFDDAFTTAGWGVSNVSTAGGLTMTNSNIEFTGCREIYGSTTQYPFIAHSCMDENTGGQGDGFGTGSMTGSWYFNNDIFRYNFQDGLDSLHSGAQSETVINSQAYGNDGDQFKFGDVDTALFQNNFALGNCNRIIQPFNGVTIAKSGVNPCRSGGTVIDVAWAATGRYLFQNNTFIGVGWGILQIGCESSWSNCSTASTALENNVLAGYTDSDGSYNAGGQAQAFVININEGAPVPANGGWAIRDHNDFYNVTGYRPKALGDLTLDPQFIEEPPFKSKLTASTESVLDNYKYMPSAHSPMLGGGKTIPSITTDANDVVRPNPPSIGALEYSGVKSPSTETQSRLAMTPWYRQFLSQSGSIWIFCLVLISGLIMALASSFIRFYRSSDK